MALQMYRHHRVPVVLGHVKDYFRTYGAGVVDEDVELAKRVDRGLDDALAALHRGHAIGICDRLAAGGADFCGHLSRDALVGAFAEHVRAEVVDYNLCAFGREQDRLRAPDSAARAGYDCDLAVESLFSLLRCHRRLR